MKKVIAILAMFVALLAVIFIGFNQFNKTQQPNSPAQALNYPAKIESKYANEQNKPIVNLINAKADGGILTIVLSLINIPEVRNSTDFDNTICDPAISTNQPIELVFLSKEGRISSDGSQPITVIYEYTIKNTEAINEMVVDLDWTFGPCGNFADNSGATASPAIDIIADTKVEFTVKLK